MTSDTVGTPKVQISTLPSDQTTIRPRVFVLSDMRLLRDGLTQALALQPTVEVVGSCDLSAPPGHVGHLDPDALLVDITLPGSLDRSQPFREAASRAKVVCLGVAEIEPVVMACAGVGVSGFVAPNGSVADLLAAVHSAMRGELVCSPRTAGILLNRVSALAASRRVEADSEKLTQREREIACCVGDGLSNKQIALMLGIQSATVKNHVHSILGKLKMRRRMEIVGFSRREATHSPDRIPENHPPHDHAMVHDRTAIDLDQTV
ncbi:MAG: response regulator transcription factor [Reyranellaceae bacterium]